MPRKCFSTLLVALCASAASIAAAATTSAIILRDQTPLRAAPREAAQQQAVLWQGEAVEIRGERLDYVQVYDHRRERGGFVRAQNVRRLRGSADEAPELLAVLRFLRETPGSEALAIGLAGAFIQAAPASVMQGEAGIEVLDILGTVAQRLAQRATALGNTSSGTSRSAETTLAAHLDVAARYGIKLASQEHEGRMRICYDGAAFQRVLTLRSTPEQRARAALTLTRSECIEPNLRADQRTQLDEWRALVLDQVDVTTLPGYVKNRVHLRRAEVWSALAYQRARRALHDGAAQAAAERALTEIAAVNKLELPDEDQRIYNDAAMRVGATRWAAVPAVAAETNASPARPYIVTETRQPGEACVLLVDAQHDAKKPLATRCTYALVWANSATVNREGTALALAVQPLETWRELWVFRKEGNAWRVDVLPPAPTTPEIGYAEFAGWVPGGKLLLAREARGDGKYRRAFELLRLETLTPEREARDPTMLASFQRWQDPLWKRTTLSVR